MTVYVVRCEGVYSHSTIGVYDDLNKAIKKIRKMARLDIIGEPEKEIRQAKKIFDRWEKSLKNGLPKDLTISPCVAEDVDTYYSIEKFEIE